MLQTPTGQVTMLWIVNNLKMLSDVSQLDKKQQM